MFSGAGIYKQHAINRMNVHLHMQRNAFYNKENHLQILSSVMDYVDIAE